MISAPFVSEKSAWAENLDFRGFHMFWDSTKMSKIFADKKIIFFEFKKKSHTFFFTFFEKKIQHFFKIWKILGFSKIKKTNTFWTQILSSQKFRVFYFWKFQYFSDFGKMLDFFSRKMCAKKFWTRKKYFFVGEKFWNFQDTSE